MISRSFNKPKAINSLIYISYNIADSNGVADIYYTLKMLYLAEIKHLKKYGRLITDDLIVRFEHGSTPSNSYDLLKKSNKEPSFEVLDNKSFRPKKQLDLEELSESDIECLIESINENKELPFPELKKKAHDLAYNKAKDSSQHYVPIEYLFEQENLSKEQIQFINEHYDFQNLMAWLHR